MRRGGDTAPYLGHTSNWRFLAVRRYAGASQLTSALAMNNCVRGPWILGVAIGLAACLGSPSAYFAEPSAPRREADSVSFRNGVMAVLSRSGCNAGTCHG